MMVFYSVLSSLLLSLWHTLMLIEQAARIRVVLSLGMLLSLDPNLIAWRSKKQLTVSKSFAEAEYRVVAYVVAEIIWIRKLLHDLGIVLSAPTKVLCDNISSTYPNTNAIHHQHSKHIAFDYHFVGEHAAHGDLVICYVPTQF